MVHLVVFPRSGKELRVCKEAKKWKKIFLKSANGWED